MSTDRDLSSEKPSSPENIRLHEIVIKSAKYLDDFFGIKVMPLPDIEVIEEPHDNLEALQHDKRVRPFYNLIHNLISCPIKELLEIDYDRPLEPVILEELGHAYVAQKRPDIKQELVNIVNRKANLTATTAKRFVCIHLWNEGVANVFHLTIGKTWCQQNATREAVENLHLDEPTISMTDEDIKLIPHIVATLSDLDNFRASRDISELHHAIDELDRISYRSGYVFVKEVIDYLQAEHQYKLVEAIDWVIANGPMDKVDELKDPLSWVKRKLSENTIIDN